MPFANKKKQKAWIKKYRKRKYKLHKIWVKKNKDKIKDYELKRRPKKLIDQAIYREKNRKYLRKLQLAWYYKNKKKSLIANRNWYKNNKERYNKRERINRYKQMFGKESIELIEIAELNHKLKQLTKEYKK